ncbi:peptidase M55 [Candidatus Bathyarchaeota archaeon]|nr:MAG: peptidase M55 [Candidatus Bathyarchaeota archaeon]
MWRDLMSKQPKRVFISIDMEGITGIVNWEQTGGQTREYEVGRKLMVGDLNAAIEGALEAGAEEIVVSDAHGGMRNIQPEDLHEAAVLVRGSPKPYSMMEGIDPDFDAAMFIGYHARMGAPRAILCHTYSGATVESIHINGLEVGETGLNAALAGHYGVPVVFISGDEAVAEEARGIIPNITAAVVKWAVGRQAARCLHPKKARELIKRKAAEALRNLDRVEPFRFEPPIEVRLKFLNPLMADVAELLPYVERLDGTTIKAVYKDYPEAYCGTRAAIYLAGTTVRRR